MSKKRCENRKGLDHDMLLLMTIAFAVVGETDGKLVLPRPSGLWPLTKRYEGLDVSGNGNHGIVQGVDFDSGTVSSFIEIPNNGAMNVSSFTWLAYVRLQDMSSQGPLFNFRRSENDYNYGTHIWAVGSGSFFLRPMIKEPYTLGQSYSLPVLTDTAWVYAGFTYNFQTGIVGLWSNGVEVGQFQNTPQLNHITDTPVRMGARHSSTAGTRYFSGAMKCVQWYGTVLSAEQIQKTVELCREPVHEARFKLHQDVALGIDTSLIYKTKPGVRSVIECSMHCSRDYNCLSLNYLKATLTCELSNVSGFYNSSLELTERAERVAYAQMLHHSSMFFE